MLRPLEAVTLTADDGLAVIGGLRDNDDDDLRTPGLLQGWEAAERLPRILATDLGREFLGQPL